MKPIAVNHFKLVSTNPQASIGSSFLDTRPTSGSVIAHFHANEENFSRVVNRGGISDKVGAARHENRSRARVGEALIERRLWDDRLSDRNQARGVPGGARQLDDAGGNNL
jgi:hypothetical protein